MRIIRSIGLALCAALAIAGSGLSYAYEAPARLVAFVAEKCGDLHGAESARLNATLTQWRTGVGAGAPIVSGSLRKSSNHFVMSSADQRIGAEEYEGFTRA